MLVDNDVIEVLNSLSATIKTLSSGILFETVPEGLVRIALFRRLKLLFDEMIQPHEQPVLDQALKVSDAVDILNFLTYTATVNSNSRPRSRQYLDLLNVMAAAAPANQAGSLIVP